MKTQYNIKTIISIVLSIITIVCGYNILSFYRVCSWQEEFFYKFIFLFLSFIVLYPAARFWLRNYMRWFKLTGFVSPGAVAILKERGEQVLKHGRSIERDIEENQPGDLVQGAIAILDQSSSFPMHWDEDICAHMAQKDKIDRLKIAGAFIAAEIDRELHK